MDIRKALDLASSAAAYLIPDVVDGAIRDFASKQPLMYNAVTKRPWATNTYWIKKKLSLPSASWSTDGGPLPAATNSTFGEAFKSMKYLYTRGEVTGPMQAAAGSVFDALQDDIQDHQQAMVEKLSKDIVTANGGAADITGILYQITNDNEMFGELEAEDGGVSVTTTTGGLTLAKLDAFLDSVPGATALVTTSAVKRKISSLLQAQQRFVDRTEIQAGFRVLSYNDVPIISDNFWKDDAKILAFDRSRARLLVHKDFTYEELAKTRDSVDYMIKGYFGFVLEGNAGLLQGFNLS